MERKVVTVTHVVTQLVDPKPTFVSLVDHGANQTPFKVVKAQFLDMNPDTHKFLFAKANFADETSVKSYLTAKGFPDATPTSTDDSFECVIKAVEDFTEVKEVKCEDGVTQFVGVVKETAAKSAERPRTPATPTPTPTPTVAQVQPVAKSVLVTKSGEELVKKFDSWAAYYGNDMTLNDAIAKASEDTTPIGYCELTCLFGDVIVNIFRSGEVEKIDGVCSEFATNIKKLYALFSAVETAKGKDSEVAQKVAKSLFATERNPSVESPDATAKKTDAGGNPTETPPAPETTKPTPTPEPEPTPTPEATQTLEPEESPVEKAVAKAMESVLNEVKKLIAPLSDKLETVTKRIDDVETPTRKGADHTEVPKSQTPDADKTTKTATTDSPMKAKKSWDNGSGVA